MFSRRRRHHHRVDPHVAAFLGHDELDLLVLGDAVIAPAVPGMDQIGVAGQQLLVEGGIVVVEQILLGRDQQLFRLGQFAGVSGVDGIAQRLLARREQPALGG